MRTKNLEGRFSQIAISSEVFVRMNLHNCYVVAEDDLQSTGLIKCFYCRFCHLATVRIRQSRVWLLLLVNVIVVIQILLVLAEIPRDAVSSVMGEEDTIAFFTIT